MWAGLRAFVREVENPTPAAEHLDEMQNLIIGEKGKPQARNKGEPGGARDDVWTSWAIANQVRQTVPAGGGRLGGQVSI